MHDGTVRDLIFMEDKTNRSTILVSGGAGNCRIHLTDCTTGQSIISYKGHNGKVWSKKKKRFVCSFKNCNTNMLNFFQQ